VEELLGTVTGWIRSSEANLRAKARAPSVHTARPRTGQATGRPDGAPTGLLLAHGTPAGFAPPSDVTAPFSSLTSPLRFGAASQSLWHSIPRALRTPSALDPPRGCADEPAPDTYADGIALYRLSYVRRGPSVPDPCDAFPGAPAERRLSPLSSSSGWPAEALHVAPARPGTGWRHTRSSLEESVRGGSGSLVRGGGFRLTQA
jgi:hypothetical protein